MYIYSDSDTEDATKVRYVDSDAETEDESNICLEYYKAWMHRNIRKLESNIQEIDNNL